MLTLNLITILISVVLKKQQVKFKLKLKQQIYSLNHQYKNLMYIISLT